MTSVQKRPSGQWRARYRDDEGHEHAKHFARKVDAQSWLNSVTAALVGGTHVTPRNARTTLNEWSDTWLMGYRTRRPSTVRQAEVHLAQIRAEFGSYALGTIRPSQVRSWTAQLQTAGYSASYVHALHKRLAQLLSDAVHDGLLPRSPCSRRTSPSQGSQRPYVATTEQVWALLEAFPAHLRAAVLLAAFAGLRVAEVCGLRVSDVDFMRGIIHPAVQYPAEALKSETSRTAIPIPASLAAELSAHVATWRAFWLLTDVAGRQLKPAAIDRTMQAARVTVPGLPAGFRFHDLRHYYASMLIASGADVKIVQARLRHASAVTTLDTYSHLWPDSDDTTRAAVDAILSARADSLRTRADN